MRRLLFFTFAFTFAFAAFLPATLAQSSGTPATEPAPPPTAGQQPGAQSQAALNTQAALVVATNNEPQMPGFIEELADNLLDLLQIRNEGNSWERYLLAAGVLVVFYLLRRLALPLILRGLRGGVGRASRGLAEKIFPAIETPVALLIMACGVYVAVRTLKYPPEIGRGAHVAAKLLFALTLLWITTRLIGAAIDFLHEKAKARDLSITPFIPWMRKTVTTVVFATGALMIARDFGWPVEAFLAGLGIGGLAFALAAQDTIANIFGAVVVAIDRPFRAGDTVQLAGHTGIVEDVGIRSMRIRRPDKALVVIPNKTVATESIVNLSRFTNRRVEQVLGFTYASTPAQMETIAREVKALIEAQPEVLPGSVMAYFRDFSASSLDLWIVYVTREPDFAKHMELRQRLNLEFMRLAAARDLSFAFPTQTLDLAPSAARALGRAQA